MAWFLVATSPIRGHVAPFAPVVRQLTTEGHEVVWYGSASHRELIEKVGATFAPITRALDFGDGDFDRHFPERLQKKGLRQIVYDFEKIFVDSVPGMADDLFGILRGDAGFAADALLYDPTFAAGANVGLSAGIPYAMLNITVAAIESPEIPPFGIGLPFRAGPLGLVRNKLAYTLVDQVVFRAPNAAYRKICAERGWPIRPARPAGSPYLNLQPSVAEAEYPVRNFPPTLHFIGPLLPEAQAFTPPPWWDSVIDGDRPVVLVTQGTVATDPRSLIIPTLRALAEEDVQVIAATGGPTADELGIAIPDNCHVLSFIPFTTVMEHVDVYVTNGGFGGVMIALTNGVPVVVAGTTEDKAEVAARVAHRELGIRLRTSTPQAAAVRRAVRTLLDDPGYTERAARVGKLLRGQDAPAKAVRLLERLADTGEPVVAP